MIDMPELKRKTKPKIIKIKLGELLKETLIYIFNNKQFMLCVAVVNMVFMLFLKSLGGISNPLSILWLIAYYVFWCWFYRYYYDLRPYFSGKIIFGSLSPSTKALVIMFLATVCIIFMPMIPLFLGFNDVYLNFYEQYAAAVENLSSPKDISTSLIEISLICLILSLLAPILICKPYMAWISSLRGTNSSFKKAADKIKGNYATFVIISAILLFPEALADRLDVILGLQNWFSYVVGTLIFIYTNVIFAKIYDYFYLKN
jgi:hypothetical protein